MATNLGFSFLTNGLAYLLNPSDGDKLTFDNAAVSASQVKVFDSSSGIVVLNTTLDNKLAGFVVSNDLKLTMKNLSTTFVKFSDGSLLKVGDNTLGTSNDDLANKLVGGIKNDHLIGLGGNDTLTGGGGRDFLEGGTGNDRLDGGTGNDVFLDSQGANRFFGGDGDDVFFAQGASGVNAGADTATGGAGRDTYYVTNSGLFFPVVTYTVTDFHTAGAGHDIINISSILSQSASSSSTFYNGQDPFVAMVRVVQSGDDALVQADQTGADTFGGFATVLTVKGAIAEDVADCITGYRLGDSDNNVLIGDGSNEFLFAADGKDVLDGGGGADNMFGGAGNDTYHVDNGGDVVRETSNADGQGTDAIFSTVNYTLPDFVENLRLMGDVAKEGVGNSLSNTINGNALANVLKGLGGDDVLNGGAGIDTLLGGDGSDRLAWTTGDTLKGEAGTDVITIAANLNLTTLDDGMIKAEQIDMTGGTNTLILAQADVLALSDEINTIKIFGDSTDTVDISGNFTAVGDPTGHFQKYKLGDGAFLLIDTDITHVV